jgi:alkanesulfonate monooxygenase SsuD/methylene tetrahydromethanopterin reductase-like flavin-dependent oxidoreductase (luciferase family)
MEFGIFNQATLLGARATDPVEEHRQYLDELALIRQADRYGIKYTWISEHHGLEEYSHMSASESFIPFALAQTRNIHVGAGIWPLNPATNHPVRLAERAAMCDHLSEGRFEFGTGRGAGSHEIGIFGLSHDQTRANWDEVVREFRKIWAAGDYQHQGQAFSVPPCRIHPKPYGGPGTNPPMWLAVGSLPSFEKAGLHGLGALGFGFIFSQPTDLARYADIYKQAIARADPVGHYVNDNFMVAQTMLCLDDPKDARQAFVEGNDPRLGALVLRYHDTFPRPANVPPWPYVPPAMTLDQLEAGIAGGMAVGSPEEVIAALKTYEAAGADQVAFALPPNLPLAVALEVIRVFGEKVLPHFDKDPIHRTTRQRYGDRAEEMVARRESV